MSDPSVNRGEEITERRGEITGSQAAEIAGRINAEARRHGGCSWPGANLAATTHDDVGSPVVFMKQEIRASV